MGARSAADMAAMTRRALRAYAEWVGDGDVDDIAEMIALHEEFGLRIGQAIDQYITYDQGVNRNLRTRTWAAIGQRLGLTRGAAHSRWMPHVRRARERLQAEREDPRLEALRQRRLERRMN